MDAFSLSVIFTAMALGCLWTYFLCHKMQEPTKELIGTVRDSCKEAVEVAVKAANCTAEVTRGIQANNAPIIHLLKEFGGVVLSVEQGQRNTIQQLISFQNVARDTNGKHVGIPQVAAQPQDDRLPRSGPLKPAGVKRASDM